MLHQRIGDLMEFRPGVAAAELAHHFGAAATKGSAQKAVRYGHQAGKRALPLLLCRGPCSLLRSTFVAADFVRACGFAAGCFAAGLAAGFAATGLAFGGAVCAWA